MLLDLLARLDAPGLLPFSYEVIVIDNASPDPLYAEVERFKPERYRFAYHRRPQNVGAERNLVYGLRLATGELCMNLSDDDWFVPEELAEIVSVMLGDTSLAASFAAWNSFDPSTGAAIERPSFGDLIVDRHSAAELVERMPAWSLWIPEHAVYRTDMLARALFSMAISYYNFTTIRRLLAFGRVRFSSKPFYLLAADPVDMNSGDVRQSSSYGFNGWSALARSYGVFVYWASGQRLFSIPESPAQHPFLMFHRNAIYEAQHQGRMAEAVALLDYVGSITDAKLVTPDYQSTSRFLGALDEVRLAIEHLPGLSALCLVGLGDLAESMVANTLRDHASPIELRTQPHPIHRQADLCGYLTASDLARNQIIQLHGVPPGYVFSLESLKLAFGF